MPLAVARKTISVGIPAYNEELNIKPLIDSLLSQKISSATLQEIIVMADGCTDKTIEYVQSYNDSRITLLQSHVRSGLGAAQNGIVRHAHSDILVLLDADTLPANDLFLEHMSQPLIADEDIGILGANIISCKPKSLFERMTADSSAMKQDIYRALSDSNIYLCHGRARAMSRKLYEAIIWPTEHPEDSYSYLFCLKQGLKFQYVHNAAIKFRSPANFRDHVRQSLRFVDGKKRLVQHFSEETVKKEYSLPVKVAMPVIFKHVLWRPLTIGAYIVMTGYLRLLSFIKPMPSDSAYEPSATSKKIVS